MRILTTVLCIRNASDSFYLPFADQTVDKQAEDLRNISSRYERDKKFWAVAVDNLQEKIKVILPLQNEGNNLYARSLIFSCAHLCFML